MACWYPSNTAEAWFPQLRINRLAKEAAAKTAKVNENESVTRKPRRRKAETATE